MTRAAATASVAALLLVAAMTIWPVGATAAPASHSLTGTFSITSGRCHDGAPPSGSYVELQLAGVPVPNPASSCGLSGLRWTPLQQGAQGLVTGAYQPDPVPTFDSTGNSLAAEIIRPVRFLAASLGLATTCADQQQRPTDTGACPAGVAAPSPPVLESEHPGAGGCPRSSHDDCLFGDLSSLGLTWAGTGGTCVRSAGCYDQGVAVGADLSTPSCAHPVPQTGCSLQGTFTPTTGAYSLDVRAAIPFGILTGTVMHYVLRGVFTAGQTAAAPPASWSPPGPSALGAPSVSGKEPAAGERTTSAAGPASTSGAEASAPDPAAATGVGLPVQQLLGSFVLAQPSCPAGHPKGSYLVVSYGDKATPNPSSSCANGSYTLLSPGTTGLPTGRFAADPVPTFDGSGNSLASDIITPVAYNGHTLGLSTSPNDVQDAPQGPAVYAPPMALIQGRILLVDLRPLYVTYHGRPGTTCTSAWGVGCWEEGSKAAIGSYEPADGHFTLDWTASQGFTGVSASATFHLEGVFVGRVVSAPPGAGSDWLPDQYVLTGTATQAGGPADRHVGSATSVPGPAQPGSDPATAASTSSPFPSSLSAGHSSRIVHYLSALASVLLVITGGAALLLARRLSWS